LESTLTKATSTNSWRIKQLTKNDVPDTLGSWQSISRDGNRIVFDRRPDPIWGPEGYGVYWDIYTMGVSDEHGQEKQMTTIHGEDVGAGISGDGNKIGFASGRFHVGEPWDLEIFIMNFIDNPGQELQVSDNTTYLDSGVVISGDGKIIAWNTGPDTPVKHSEYITVANVSDVNHIVYTIIDTPGWDSYPTLTYDGTKVCFCRHTSGGSQEVYVANTDGTDLRQIPGVLGQPVMSGNGEKVAVLWNDGDWEFSVYEVATGNLVYTTNNGVDDWFGSINYDGSIVAYTRGGEIYTYDLQMMQETRLTNDAYEDWYPRLDEDGDTIAFVSIGRDGPDSEIFVMTALNIPTTVDIDPDTLNLGSRGKRITAYIEFLDSNSVDAINVSSLLLNSTIPIDSSAPATVGDYDQDGIQDIMVKFDRTAVTSYILSSGDMAQWNGESGNVALTLAGRLNNGQPFAGSDTVRVTRAEAAGSAIWVQWWLWALVLPGIVVGVLAPNAVHYRKRTLGEEETDADQLGQC
jgi:Tol biopolymer transport system component